MPKPDCLHDTKRPPLRRADLEELALAVGRYITYFIGNVLQPDGTLTRDQITLVKRYVGSHFGQFTRMAYDSVHVIANAPWMDVEQCHAGGKFSMTIRIFENPDEETAQFEYAISSRIMSDGNGTEQSSAFEAELRYIWYE